MPETSMAEMNCSYTSGTGRCMNPKAAKRCSKRVLSELKGMSGLAMAPQAISPVATRIRAWHICLPTSACCACMHHKEWSQPGNAFEFAQYTMMVPAHSVDIPAEGFRKGLGLLPAALHVCGGSCSTATALSCSAAENSGGCLMRTHHRES